MEDCEKIQYDFVSEMAGEYIESTGKSDLAKMSKDEWYTLLECIVKAYHEAPRF